MLSQVVLSFGIPFALIPLIRLTSNRDLMGDDVNHRDHHCSGVDGRRESSAC